jgi:hypothetical protein
MQSGVSEQQIKTQRTSYLKRMTEFFSLPPRGGGGARQYTGQVAV